MKKCEICGEFYDGYGNNAEPVMDGKCCDKCNTSVVIPARLASIGSLPPKARQLIYGRTKNKK